MAKKKKSDYWTKRQEAIDKDIYKKVDKETEAIIRAYEEKSAVIEIKINDFYARFATENSMSLIEAKKVLTSSERKNYQMSLEEYIQKGKTLNYTQKYATQLENASTVYHLSKFEAQKIEMAQEVVELSNLYHDKTTKLVNDVYTNSYNHNAYEAEMRLGTAFGAIDTETAKLATSQAWTSDGRTFSDRIWQSQEELINFLNVELKKVLISGANPETLIKVMQKKFNVKASEARRLIQNEAAFFNAQGRRDFYENANVKKYQISATLDSRTSDICQHQDGEVYDLEDWEVNVTAPPFHVNCRSTTIPYFEDLNKYTDSKRAARVDGSKTYHVSSNTTYQEWLGSKEGKLKLKQTESDDLKTNKANATIDSSDDFKKLMNTFSQKYNVAIDSEISTLDFKAVSESLAGLEKVLDDFEVIQEHLTRITVSGQGLMSTDFTGKITLNPNVYVDYEKVKTAATKNIFVKNAGVLDVGTHEAGHLIEIALIQKNQGEDNLISQLKAWDACTQAKSVIREAVSEVKKQKKYASVSIEELIAQISHYALQDPSECLAEAITDYYVNGDKSAPLSKMIYEIVKRRLK